MRATILFETPDADARTYRAMRVKRRLWMVMFFAGAAIAGCEDARGAPGMDVVGEAMVYLGESLQSRGAELRDRAGAASSPHARETLLGAAAWWLEQGEATVEEGKRIVRSAGIVGQHTRGGRVPANASRVVIFGVEAEADALITTAGRLAERSRLLRVSTAALEIASALPAAGVQALLADVEALDQLSTDARRAGEAMREQARRFRRGLGQRESDDRVR
jgi:hypothetical protein